MTEQNLNQTIFQGDKLEVLRGINSGTVDLIYLDPPFNSKKHWNAPIGSKAAGAHFKDTWSRKDIDLQWEGQLKERNPAILKVIDAAKSAGGKPTGNYLLMMAPRLVEMERVLKPDGAIYLHCDDAEVHGLKLLMDTIFGRSKFRNEIIWKRHSGHYDAGYYGRITDRILFYGNKKIRDEVTLPVKETRNKIHTDERGDYSLSYMQGPRVSGGVSGEAWRGWSPTQHGRSWAVPTARLKGTYGEWIAENIIPGYEDLNDDLMGRLDALDEAGMIVWTRTGNPQIKRYTAARRGLAPSDLWDDIVGIGLSSKERVRYPTQKPLRLLDRIIRASSEPGDVVLDPFCGCATAAIAAEAAGRKWIGIDLSEMAYELVRGRLRDELQIFSEAATLRTDIPQRTDLGDILRYNDPKNKTYLYGIQRGYCNLCETHLQEEHLTIDHIVPQQAGGSHHRDNLQLLCLRCNSRKGTKRWEVVKREYWAAERGI